MELSDSRTKNNFINTTLDIRIKDFSTTTKQVSTSKELSNSYNDFEISFFASAQPYHNSKNLDDWLVVYVRENIVKGFLKPYNTYLVWIVSIIDEDGNSRFSRTFRNHRFRKYLKTSFMLSKADELLTKDVLTVRFEVYFSWSGIAVNFDPLLCSYSMQRGSDIVLNDFYRLIPQSVSFKDDDTSDSFVVYDFTSQILTLPQFHETRERFGVYGVPPCDFPWIKSKSEINTNDFGNIWMFETDPDKFILSLNDRSDNVGALLLKTSDFIKRCVSVPMKEQQEKRIDFTIMHSHTLKMLLFFLHIGTVSFNNANETLELYNFSHMYQLNELQKTCADQMVRDFSVKEAHDLLNIAKHLSDEYLLTQLFLKLDGYQIENSLEKGLKKDNRLNNDCYV